MKYIVNRNEMKQYDKNTIQHFGIPACVLMERAALFTADEIERHFRNINTVLIVAGTGNNGGDGIALGRILWQRGYAVTFCLLGTEERCSEETKKQIEIIKKYSLSIANKVPQGEYDIIIDAIFGIGFNREIDGIYKQAVDLINGKKGRKIALDIPTGICADSGKILGACIRADLTVTFAFEKAGLLFYPGASFCGEIICAEIGITQESFMGKPPGFICYEKVDLKKLPHRVSYGNKGTFGKILLIAGSNDMNGAAILAARSAYRMGAGMVRIFTAAANKEVLQTAIPEALLTTYEQEKEIEEKLSEGMEWADVIAVGPGIGMSDEAGKIVKLAITTKKPLICDADALNHIAQDLSILEKMQSKDIVFTPHLTEFSRLCQKTVAEIREDRIEIIQTFAKKYGITLVCKDARTIVSYRGEENAMNNTGNEGMATAGSGDVLTGMIAALSAQGLSGKEAAMLGVYIHGLAGDYAKEKSSSYAVMASDLIEEVKYMLGENRNETL